MAEWRVARGWSRRQLRKRLAELADASTNFAEDPSALSAENGWRYYASSGDVGVESPGPPVEEGPFRRMAEAVADYRFSDPDIVEAHYDASRPLLGRVMLLELKPLALRFLCGVRVGAVRDQTSDEETVFAFRYETLEGHVERGAEWFVLTKEHASGRITFEIRAHWKPGDFPNWWSRAGFRFLAPRYQRRWHREAHRRLSAIAAGAAPERADTGLTHEGPALRGGG